MQAAEMDFKTAPSVIQSITDMAQRGIYGFTVITDDYKNAVKWWLKEERNWEIDGKWISPVLGTRSLTHRNSNPHDDE